MKAGPRPSPAPPVVWSVSGLDSGGGAGLCADQRAADAAGVHLCPVAAALTAQNSVAVCAVHPVPPAQLEAQLEALAGDLPPAAVKTGLLGGVEQVRTVARWIDRLRRGGPVALVVDPVLRATTGADFADAALLRAYRDELCPRASFVTPNREEAARLLGLADAGDDAAQAGRARALRRWGAQSVCITGGDARGARACDWIDTAQATGWLSLPRSPTRHTHGSGCTHATALAAALAQGFVHADAAVLAKMLTRSGLDPQRGFAGAGAGPVRPVGGFALEPAWLPTLVDDGTARDDDAPPPAAARPASPVQGVYGIAADAAQVAALFAGGLRTVQLRLKRAPGQCDADWTAGLRAAILQARDAARAHSGTLVVNDHWRDAWALGVDFVHLGQQDLLALDAGERAALAQARRAGLRLGVSSHSLWELARAHAWRPDYIACGPVWPTLTKAMPWRPQGLSNLAWWVAMAPAPVVGIGGVLEPAQLAQIASTGAAAGCVVRGLAPGSRWPASRWLQAWDAASRQPRRPPPPAPHPTLDGPAPDGAPPR